MRKAYNLNLRGENDVSEKHGTDELVEYLWQLVTVSTNHSEGRDVDIGKMSIIVSKLKVADKLCDAAKLARESQGWDGNDPDEIRWPELYAKLRKAIADYEGKED